MLLFTSTVDMQCKIYHLP